MLETKEITIHDLIHIPEVPWNTKFWIVRTKSGKFFEEFVGKEFIALGWNALTKQAIERTSTKQQKEELRDRLKDIYGDDVKTRGAYNKCEYFIYDINEGDILVIPGVKSKKIAIARAGEYFEVEDNSIEREIEVTKQIEDGWDDTFRVLCPYNKRRKIEVIKILEGEYIHPNLYRALNSRHGICSIDDISETVLNTLYDLYFYNGKVTAIFHVQKTGRINTKALSGFMFNLSCILENIADEESISSKVNVNSPGDIATTIETVCRGATDFINSNGWIFLLACGALCGGKFFGCEFNSFLDIVLKFRDQNSKLKTEDLNRDILKYQLEQLKKTGEKIEIKNDDTANVTILQEYITQQNAQEAYKRK